MLSNFIKAWFNYFFVNSSFLDESQATHFMVALPWHNNACKTNCYNRSLSLFVISDNNLKMQIVIQAIVDDKTQLSYKWVFRYMKEATSVSLKVFVMNGDLAVNDAVIIEFPNTYHIYCIWHIS